jgi:hypothetical protein
VHLLLRQIELAGADVLVGVELDLLEAHDPRHHVHLAVVGDGRLVTREAVENGDLGVVDGVV